HSGITGVGQNTARAEGPRSKLHPAMMPGDHSPLRDLPRGLCTSCGAIGEALNPHPILETRDRGLDCRVVIVGTEKRRGKSLVMNRTRERRPIKRCADCGAV